MFTKKYLFLCFFINKIFCAPWTINKNNNPVPLVQINDYNYEKVGQYDGSDLDDKSDGVNHEDEYHSFFEKKVAKIIYNGGVYLEGLRRALQNYANKIDNCTSTYTSFRSSNNPNESSEFKKCQQAISDRDRVRRVAQLAVFTTREIQDRIVTGKDMEDEIENKTLLLRLAWLLDKLAQMTGYNPKPEDYLSTDTPLTTPLSNLPYPSEYNFDTNVTEDKKMTMIKCLDRNDTSSQPAYERCPPETPMIPSLRKLFTKSDIAPATVQPKTKRALKKQNGARKRRETYTHGRKPISRTPEDPLQDISAYVKSKPGTNIMNNLQENVQLRLSLEQAFQNPNIEVTRRFASNYNPLIPNVVISGVIRSALDV